MIRCPACGAENKSSTKFCRGCGATLPSEARVDDERTVLLPPQPARSPGIIEQAMQLSPDARKPADRPPPTPPDNDMTVILPKQSSPQPKYEPAPPTVTGPLTEPLPHGRSSKARASSRKPSDPATAKKLKTPIAVVLALLVVAGGSAGYLGWLILKQSKKVEPAEKVAVAPPAAEPAKPPQARTQPPAPADAVPPPASAVPAAPAAPVAPAAPAAPSAVALSPATPAAAPPTPKPTPKAEISPVPVLTAPPAEVAKPDASKAERAKAEQLKKEQAKLEAAKREKQKKPAATAPIAPRDPGRPAESQRPAPAPAAEPVKLEPAPLALLRDELRACDGQSVFTRESCKQQARQHRCAGMWDRVPECPYHQKELY